MLRPSLSGECNYTLRSVWRPGQEAAEEGARLLGHRVRIGQRAIAMVPVGTPISGNFELGHQRP
jgi:hypothetical protein